MQFRRPAGERRRSRRAASAVDVARSGAIVGSVWEGGLDVPSIDHHKYWFPAKRYGWGWGPPVTWQGWVVLSAYILALLAGVPRIRSTLGNAAAIAYVVALSVALVVAARNVLLPAFGRPMMPASAISLSRSHTARSSPGQPLPCSRGARLVELL